MSKHSFTAGRVLASLALPLVATWAGAQSQAQETQPATTELGRVAVSGRPVERVVKFNVQQVCPTMAAELQESLEGLAWHYGGIGLHRVDFKLTGREISEVQAPASVWDARRPIKRAIKALHCDGGNAGTESYAFLLQVLDPDAPQTRASVAAAQAPTGELVLVLAGR
jgi:hypothetical protein